jgi:hypothetical protein
VDHQLTPSDLLTARYYINDSDTYNSGTYGIPESDPLGDITDVRVQSLLGSYTHIFIPRCPTTYASPICAASSSTPGQALERTSPVQLVSKV